MERPGVCDDKTPGVLSVSRTEAAAEQHGEQCFTRTVTSMDTAVTPGVTVPAPPRQRSPRLLTTVMPKLSAST